MVSLLWVAVSRLLCLCQHSNHILKSNLWTLWSRKHGTSSIKLSNPYDAWFVAAVPVSRQEWVYLFISCSVKKGVESFVAHAGVVVLLW